MVEDNKVFYIGTYICVPINGTFPNVLPAIVNTIKTPYIIVDSKIFPTLAKNNQISYNGPSIYCVDNHTYLKRMSQQWQKIRKAPIVPYTYITQITA